tara:strand:+ start:277 stop:1509 length:1233 start_codon:yes stop_codon:yes gene_type:complete
MSKKPNILVISKVLPFPGESGQQMRIRYMLESLKKEFNITFLTTAKISDSESIKNELKYFVDKSIVLPTQYDSIHFKIIYKIKGYLWTLWTGLKMSNYIIGELDITDNRIEKILEHREIDIVLYEYWHAHKTITYFKKRGIPTILDMHNILWQSYKRQLRSIKWLPKFLFFRILKRYKDQEENIWKKFDGLIAINKTEFNYIKNVINKRTSITLIPMGIDLSKWNIDRKTVKPHRVGYYGGLGSIHNQNDALKCYYEIMPSVWERYPETELWIIGSQPPNKILKLQNLDSRVNVTGFVDKVQDVLQTMTIMILPWEGTYGFRSRIVEMMAIGLPVITSSDAIEGMGISEEDGVFCAQSINQYVNKTINILSRETGDSHSTNRGKKIKGIDRYDVKHTYGHLSTFVNSIFN